MAMTLLQENLWIFLRITKIASYNGVTSLQWDAKHRTLVHKADAKTQRRLKRNTYAHTLFVLLLCIQFIVGLMTREPLISMLMSVFGLILGISLNLYLRCIVENEGQIKILLNGVVALEDGIHSDKKVQYGRGLLEKLNLLFASLTPFTGILYPVGFAVGVHHFIGFCKPSMVGFWVLAECRTVAHCGNGLSIGKILIYFGNIWFLNLGAWGTVFMLSNVQILGTLSIKDLLKMFWALHETQNQGKIVSTYRQIQILVEVANSIFQKSLLPVFITGSITLTALGCAYLVRMPLKSGLVVLLVITNTVPAMGIYLGGIAAIYAESKIVKGRMRMALGSFEFSKWILSEQSGTSSCKRKWYKRFMQSCPLIKIKFGSLNFVDELTPLHCLDLASNLTLQMLLLTKTCN